MIMYSYLANCTEKFVTPLPGVSLLKCSLMQGFALHTYEIFLQFLHMNSEYAKEYSTLIIDIEREKHKRLITGKSYI